MASAQIRAKVSSSEEYNNTRLHKPVTNYGKKLLALVNQVASEQSLRVFPKAAAILSKVKYGPTTNDCTLNWFIEDHSCNPYLHIGTDGALDFCCHKNPEYDNWRQKFDRVHYPVFKRHLNQISNGEHLKDEDLHKFYIASCKVLSNLEFPSLDEKHIPTTSQLKPHNNNSNHNCDVNCRVNEYYNYLKAEYDYLLAKTSKMYKKVVNMSDHEAFEYYREKKNVDILYPVKNQPGYWQAKNVHQKYDKCYDGNKLHSLLYSIQEDSYSCATADVDAILLVHDGLKLVQSPRIMHVIETINIYNHKAVVTLVNGVFDVPLMCASY